MPHLTAGEARVILEENFAEWVRELDPDIAGTGDDHLTMIIPQSPRLARVGGIVCGQALISAADTAMVIALAVARGGMMAMTTVDLTINFMRPVIGEDVRLVARIRRCGKTLAFCTADIEGVVTQKPAAFATGTYAILG